MSIDKTPQLIVESREIEADRAPDGGTVELYEVAEPESGLPAFRTMWRGYKFVFTRLPTVVRLGWLDFCYGLCLFLATDFIDELLLVGQRPQTVPFRIVLLPLMGFFVLRFAVRWHRYALSEERMTADKAKAFDIESDNATVYAGLFFVCAVILALPMALLLLLVYVFGIPEPMIIPAVAAVVAFDFYVAARMSILFPQTAFIGRFPPRWTWSLSKGLVWKLLIILLLAPWPFNTALKLLAMAQVEGLWRIPLMTVGAMISFLGVAVLATILSDAYWYCLERNQDLVERTRERELEAKNAG